MRKVLLPSRASNSSGSMKICSLFTVNLFNYGFYRLSRLFLKFPCKASGCSAWSGLGLPSPRTLRFFLSSSSRILLRSKLEKEPLTTSSKQTRTLRRSEYTSDRARLASAITSHRARRSDVLASSIANRRFLKTVLKILRRWGKARQ